jgi:hypothetical protein
MKTIKLFKLHYVAIALLVMVASCIPLDTEFTDLEGTWGCSETSTIFGNPSYEVNITTDASNPNIIYLENFYGLGYLNTVTANVSGDYISISTQTVDGWQISGSGTINNENSLSFEYTAYNGADTDTVTSTYTRK